MFQGLLFVGRILLELGVVVVSEEFATFRDLLELVDLWDGGVLIKTVHDLVAESHYFFEGFDELRKILEEISFGVMFRDGEVVVIHNINQL